MTSDDPSIDEDGFDLSVCRGLRERLDQIDDEYRSMSAEERTPAVLRQSALRMIRAICEVADHHSPILAHLEDGLILANAGRRHPIFAINAEELENSRPAGLNAVIEGNAAASLEYAYTDLRQRQSLAAQQIADQLATSGFKKSDGNKYSAGAVIKWRKACIEGCHAGALEYQDTLRLLRSHKPKGCGLRRLALICENYSMAPRR